MKLKKILKNLVSGITANDAAWFLISKGLVYPSQVLRSFRKLHLSERIVESHDTLKQGFRERVVLGGPFAGMKYGFLEAHCSALHPKLLGSYEMELEPVLEECVKREYELLVDVGAAEGYYAVGMAMRLPSLLVVAYEQEADARAELAALASLNGVSDQISIRGRCDPGSLNDMKGKKGLMIVDCEGFEADLLTSELIADLKQWDFVIETHDGIRPGVTVDLETIFARTHVTRRIAAVNDLDRVDIYDSPVLSGIGRGERARLMAEGRQHATVCWLYCQSKTWTEN